MKKLIARIQAPTPKPYRIARNFGRGVAMLGYIGMAYGGAMGVPEEFTNVPFYLLGIGYLTVFLTSLMVDKDAVAELQNIKNLS